MPIREAAARLAARRILTSINPHVSETAVDMAASILTNSVLIDELQARMEVENAASHAPVPLFDAARRFPGGPKP